MFNAAFETKTKLNHDCKTYIEWILDFTNDGMVPDSLLLSIMLRCEKYNCISSEKFGHLDD